MAGALFSIQRIISTAHRQHNGYLADRAALAFHPIDALNRLTNMVDAAGTTIYAYAAGGQLWTEDGPWASDTVTNTYNNRMRTGLSLAQPTGKWTNSLSYDAAKRLTNVTSPAGTFSYLLAAASAASPLPKKIILPNTSYITNTYDNVARLKGTYLKTSANVLTNKHEYNYNAGHQRINSTNLAGTFYTNTYDKIGQLKIADSSVNSEDRGYLYDAAWNLNFRTNNGALQTFKVDEKNQLTNTTGVVGTVTNDANGNLTFAVEVVIGNAYGYAYDDENQLVNRYFYRSASNGNGSPLSLSDLRTEFIYDGKGRLRKRVEYTVTGASVLVWTVASETRYVYDGMRVIQERSEANRPTVSYTRGTDLSGSLEGAGGIGGLLGRSHGYSIGNGSWSTHSFYHADGNGNVTYLLNSAQTKVAEYRYDPFGSTISSSGTLAAANVYRFSSKEIHVSSGLYYYGYRFYDPNLQRWLNRDPLGDETVFAQVKKGKTPVELAFLEYEARNNLFQFDRNNPLNYVDSNGQAIVIVIPAGTILVGGTILICIISPPCLEAAKQLARELAKEISRCRPKPPEADCVKIAETRDLCLYKCSSPAGSYMGSKPKPYPGAPCDPTATHDDAVPRPGRDYPGFPGK